MAVNVIEYMNKIGEEGLTAIKQSQEASLEAMKSFGEFTKQFTEQSGSMPSFENFPTPAKFVELSFGFASQMLELRKASALKLAEMIAETQKQVQATVPNSMPNAGTMPNKPPVK